MKKMVKVGLLLFVVGLIGSIMLIFSGVGFKKEEVMEKKEFDSSKIQNVSIRTDVANIYLKPAKGKQVNVELMGNTTRKIKTAFTTSTDQRTLEISVEQKKKLFNIDSGFNSDSLDLLVYLPEKMYDTLNINTDLGTISSDYKITTKNATFITDLGNIELTGFEGETITAETSLGEIIMKEINATFQFQADKGDIELLSVDNLTGTNSIRTDLGNANVIFRHDPKALNLDLSTELGDIKTNFSVITTVSGGEALKDITSQQLKGQYGEAVESSPSLTIITELGDIALKK